MNSNSETVVSMIEIGDDGSISMDDEMRESDYSERCRTHITRSSAGSTSSTGTTTTTTTTNNGVKRQKDMSPCYVCGATAHGYNFDQITCESCKAFFRRNALKSMDKFRCRNSDSCIVTAATRKRCKRCRLTKCFNVGMRKEWILTDEEKCLKRRKIERNRMIKQQTQAVPHQESNHSIHSNLQTNTNVVKNSSSSSQINSQNSQSLLQPFSLMYMYHPPDQHMYDRQQYILEQLSNGYQSITKQYPQPNKFVHRNLIISQTINMDIKLTLIKDLTRELTQMTTLRLLNFFNLIPEFQLLLPQEKQSILIQNMLAVFMFHGALTYNADNDTFVDRATTDQPYDAKYLLFVYGPKVYNDFIALARELTSITYQTPNDKQADERSHTLLLLLMVILLFSNGFQLNSIEYHQPNLSKLNKIQQSYIDLACRFLHDRFGFAVGRRMFHKLVPILCGLQRLCSTLANVNLCEMVEDEDRSASSRTTTTTTTNHYNEQSTQPLTIGSSSEFNSTMISGTSHLNELQKENRAPPPPPSSNLTSLSTPFRLSPSVLSNTTTTTTTHNYQL